MLSRKIPLGFDKPSVVPAFLLEQTLRDFLPSWAQQETIPWSRYDGTDQVPIPPGWHLIYFPPASPLSTLLPDGTDPDQSPGGPFVRRMWAGGSIKFNRTKGAPPFRTTGGAAVCLERISDVVVKGQAGEEKIFVTLKRSMTDLPNKGGVRKMTEDQVREYVGNDSNCKLIEERSLVFLKERSPEAAADAAKAPGKIVKPQHEPTFSHTFIPTPALLFRFSALTFNAHRIHLDKEYCRITEGHRNLLFHGPLSLVFMLELLRKHLQSNHPDHVIHGVNYRNLAPLYAEEPMKVCGRSKGENEWDVWIEGSNGGYAVKGVVTTIKKERGTTIRRSRPSSDDSAKTNSTESEPTDKATDIG